MPPPRRPKNTPIIISIEHRPRPPSRNLRPLLQGLSPVQAPAAAAVVMVVATVVVVVVEMVVTSIQG